MTQVETLPESGENLWDANKSMILEDVPEGYQIQEIAIGWLPRSWHPRISRSGGGTPSGLRKTQISHPPGAKPASGNPASEHGPGAAESRFPIRIC